MRQSSPSLHGMSPGRRETGLFLWLAGALLLLASMFWPQAARAQTASPRCPTPFTLSIPHSGSGTINANACHEGFGIGFLMVAPAHGTVTIDTLASTVTYAHNGNSATSDTFRFDDGSGFYVQVDVTIGPASSITIAPASLPAMTAGTAYSQTLTASGGTGPYTYTLDSGTLPTGLTLSNGGVLSGTPTQRGPFAFAVRATDSTSAFGTKSYNPTVAGGTLSLTPNPPPNAVIGVPYSVTFTPSGGVAPMTIMWEPNGSFPLPPGLSLSGNTLSGTPTSTGSFTFGIRITDSSTGPGSWFQVVNVTLTVAAPPTIVVNPATVPGATVGSAYSQTLSGSGGTAPYSLAVTAGALPAGLTLATGGGLTGTPTAGGTFNFTATATDDNGFTGSRAYTLTVAAPTIAVAPTTLPSGTVGAAYSQSISANGGTSPYSFAVTAGALPAGLSLASNGALSGTPTAGGTFNFTVTATDSSTGTGPYTGSRAYSLTIAAPTISVSPTSLPSGTVNTAYSQTITASGGTSTYSFAVTAGALPAGVSLASDGTLSGTPTAGGTFNFAVTATDSSTGTGPYTGTRAYSLTIAAPTISLSPTTLPSGTRNVAYNQSITATGGTSPYSFAVTAGALPAGVSLASDGTLSGTPTASGTFNFAVTATDSSTGTGPFTGTRAYSLLIAPPAIALSPSLLPAGTVGSAYSQTITASGGTAPYTFNVTAGALPAGLSLSSAGDLSGTPTAGGSFNFTVTATDANSDTGSQAYTLVIAAPTVSVAPVSLPGATVGTGYSEAITATGGTAPYSFAVTAGTLPGGLTLAGDGTLSGTPTAAGTFNFTVTATDSSTGTGPYTGGRAFSVVVAPPVITLSPGTVPGGTVGSAYSQTITASGGTSPYTFAVTAGALPAGLTLSSAGALSGTPTEGGSFNFTVTATDANSDTGSQAYTLAVAAPTVTIAPASLPAATVGGAYSQSVTASGGTAPYSYAVTAGALPAGLSLSSAGVLSGAPTAGGSFNFTVTATDSSTGTGPFTGSRAYSLTVNAPTVALAPATLPDGAISSAYSQSITASGATAPYTFAVTAGTLPTGLTLSSAGVLSGTPTVTGTYNFTVTATDSSTGTGPYTGSQAYSLVIADIAPVANAVSATVAFDSGANPITLNITGGAPASVAVATAPANGTAIASGTSITYQPSAGFAGSDSFTYTATNTAGTSAPATVSITVASPTITITPTGVLSTTVGAPYTQTFTWAGGTAPYSAYSATGLPVGLSVTATGSDSLTVSGTPTESGSFSLLVSAIDSSTGTGPFTTAQTFTLTVNAPALALSPAPGTFNGTSGSAFSQAISASGGTAPYSYAITAGALPAGLSLDAATGVLSGTPAEAGAFPITVTATDSSTGAGAPFSVSNNYTLQIGVDIVLSPATLPNGTTTVSYTQLITATGGTAPYVFAVASGALPPGVALATDGTLSGVPTSAGTFNFTISATDFNARIGTRTYSVQIIAAPTIVLSPSTLPDGVGSVAYAQTITASGGTAPYAFTVLTGALPTGLSLSGTGDLTGTPTATGTFNFTVRATDNNGFTGDQAYALAISAPTITLTPATLPAGVAGTAYSQTLSASGGTGPYGFSLLSGSLPAGVSFSSAGLLSGTPTGDGTFNVTVRATDANGFTGDQAYALVIAAPTITLSPGTLPDGDLGVAYSQTIMASGGAAPYSFSLPSGALPPGVSFTSAGVLSGTPTLGGTYNFVVRAADANGFTTDQSYALVIATPTITVSPATLPDGLAGTAYSQSLTASGGTGPYSFSLLSGALPTGLSFSSAGVLSGTPTTAGTFNFTVRATDDNGATGDQAYALIISAPAIVLTPATLPDALAGTAYSQTLSATGGTAPYTFSILSGGLPSGMTLSSLGVLSGTPTAGGTFNFTLRATDDNGFTADHAYTLFVETPLITLTPDVLPDGAVGFAYAQSLSATGGIAPYTFSLPVGTLPTGVTLSSTGNLSGTPTTAGTFNFTVRVTDNNGFTGDQAYTLDIAPPPTITLAPATLPGGVAGTAYSQALSASGGTAPYTFAVSAGALPAGLSMDAAATLSGTPTAAGTFNFTVTATDAGGFTGAQAYTIVIAAPSITITPASLPGSVVGAAYSQNLSAAGGTAPYGFSVSGGALPAGLSLSAAGVLGGTPTTAGTFTFEVTATDGLGFMGSRSYTVSIAAAPPVAVNDAAETDAGVPVTIAVTANDSGTIDSIALVSSPANGAAVVSGLDVQYTPNAGFFGSDSFTYTATGPGGTSNVATVTVQVNALPVPVGIAQSVTTLAGQLVSFDAAAGATGAPFTGVTLLAVPAQGVVAVSGTVISYTPAADAFGAVTIQYTLNNAFGPSAPITSTVQINPLPVAAAHSATTVAGVAVQVTLTEGATGGPFVAANVVSVLPAGSGTTAITATGPADARQYVLTFTPSAGFLGTAQVTYTLDNAFATSAPAVVGIEVTARPDPTQDAEVLGLLAAQNAAAKRFANGQINNFQSRMERLHAGAARGFDNGLTVAITRRCHDGRAQRPGERCADEPLASPGTSLAAPDGGTPHEAGQGGAVGFWAAGNMSFGDHDLQGNGNGFEFETDAISAGADYRFSPNLVLGGGLGYGRDVTDVGENGTRSEGTARTLALYGSHQPAEAFFIDLMLGYQWLSYDSRRFVAATGSRVTGERDGRQWFGSLAATYEHRSDAFTVAPYLRVDVARATLEAFTEQGDPVYALHYGEQDVDTTTGNLGARLEFRRRVGWGLFSPLLRLEYQHDFEDPGLVTLNYADLSGGPFYRARLPGQDRSRFLLGIGAIVQTNGDWLFKAEYRGLFGNDDQDEHSIMLNVEKEF